MRERRVTLSNVGIAQNQSDESRCLLDALSLIQADNMIKSNDVVVITPNFVKNMPPETGVVTGNNTLRTLISFVKGLNPRRIVVACGSGSKETGDILDELGITGLLRQESVEFIDLNHGPFTEVMLNHTYPNKTKINTLLNEMTFHISFTQLKQHEEAGMSACIKNVAMSWPPAEQHGHPKKNCGIHEDLHGFIRAMAEIIPIDLSILSTMPAMVGTGPNKGVARNAGMVIAGTDPVSVDTIGARLLGFRPQAINYLYQSIKAGIGKGKIEEMQISGLSIKDAERTFSYAVYGESFAIDE